jgi:rRNA maturation endonuclease Nob1
MSCCKNCRYKAHHKALSNGVRCTICKKILDNPEKKICASCSKQKNLCEFCEEPLKKGFFNGAGFGYN